MSFISSWADRYRDTVVVWERDEEGRRKKKEYPSPYNFYVPSPNGSFESVTGEKLEFLTFDSKKEFATACTLHQTRFESDLHPQEKVMMTYFGKKIPNLAVGFLDIEVDYDPAIGFPRPSNPYGVINSLTLYRSDIKSYFTLAIPPETWPLGLQLPKEMQDDNYFLFSNERELLEYFLELQDECDVLSGWNSEFFDVPYIGKRIELLFGQQALKRLALQGGPPPRWGEKDRFKGSKEKEIVLDLISKVHLDYMALFKKFTLGGRQSYSLNAITEEELDVPKMHYAGTLYELYRNDFIKFLQYNRHDVKCIVDLDQKFNYIGLANNMVHEATVNFSAIFGSVQLIDTAIINFCHSVMKKKVFDRDHKIGQGVEGAIVMSPKVGLHKMIGSCDINSLYPSTYRSLNLSPEKIMGQLAEYEEGWKAVYDAKLNPDNVEMQERKVKIIPEGAPPAGTLGADGTPLDSGLWISAGEMNKFLKENKYALSAYGTILDQGNGEGLLPAVLTYWFNGRKELQAKKKEFAKKAKDHLANGGTKKDPEYIKFIEMSDYYDMLQGVRKVLLNSAYGATLNEFCRFHDPRLGASTTGSGRQITTHMCQTVAQCLMGENAPPLIKTVTHVTPREQRSGSGGGDSASLAKGIINEYTMDVPPGIGPIYSDTDSCYFVMENLVGEDVDLAVQVADEVVSAVNDSFPEFMRSAFNCQSGFDTLIRANREVVATAGIFRAKKKYMLLVANNEGTVYAPDDEKALKTQGSDIKISSTPETIRGLLKDTTLSILRGVSKSVIDEKIIAFRRNLNQNPDVNPLDYASITSVKNLDEYHVKYERIELAGMGRANLPNNVRSSFNHNACLKLFSVQDSQEIISGMKIKIVWLKPNEYDFTSMAFSSDTETLPEWFTKHFEIDVRLTELKLVDQKLKNIFDPIGWEVPTVHTQTVQKLLSF
jgi:DNA polymerase elongation subunit (family B)